MQLYVAELPSIIYRIYIMPSDTNIVQYIFIIIIMCILAKLYESYTQSFEPKERIYSLLDKTVDKYELHFNLMADTIMNIKNQFILNMFTVDDFKSTFNSPDERLKNERNARDFFQKEFGLGEYFMSVFMWEYRINDKLNYKAYGVDSEPLPIVDGGFVCYLPSKKTLTGNYGGKNGIIVDNSSIIVWGFCAFGKYKLHYKSLYPHIEHTTFDGKYTPIDCVVQIIDAPDKNHIGKNGKSIGLHKISNINGLNNMISIRNTITI